MNLKHYSVKTLLKEYPASYRWQPAFVPGISIGIGRRAEIKCSRVQRGSISGKRREPETEKGRSTSAPKLHH